MGTAPPDREIRNQGQFEGVRRLGDVATEGSALRILLRVFGADSSFIDHYWWKSSSDAGGDVGIVDEADVKRGDLHVLDTIQQQGIEAIVMVGKRPTRITHVLKESPFNGKSDYLPSGHLLVFCAHPGTATTFDSHCTLLGMINHGHNIKDVTELIGKAMESLLDLSSGATDQGEFCHYS